MERQQAEQYVVQFDKWMSLLLQHGSRLTRGCSMPASQLFLARMLKFKGPSRVSDIADFLGVTSPAVTSLVNELVKSGYVNRQRITDDRRVTLIELNENGQMALDKAEKERKEKMAEVLCHLDTTDIENLLNTLAKLVEVVRNL